MPPPLLLASLAPARCVPRQGRPYPKLDVGKVAPTDPRCFTYLQEDAAPVPFPRQTEPEEAGHDAIFLLCFVFVKLPYTVADQPRHASSRPSELAFHNPLGTEYYRNQIDLIREGAVDWQPYDDLLEQMPIEVHDDSDWWFARLPLMLFWIVEFHYQDRVMRQFGLRQTIPPSLPRGEAEVRRLRKIKHTAGKSHNWEEVHANYVQEYDRVQASVLPEDIPFDVATLPDYRHWFQQNGMYTVFFDSQCLGGLDKPIPYPRDSIEWTGYMPSGPPLARIGLREIKNAAWGIKCATTTGCKKIGKSVLRSCVGNLLDLNLEPRLQSMLAEARLPLKIEDIPSDDEVSYIAHPPSPPKESNSDVFNEWIYSGKGFTTYLKAGVPMRDTEPTTQDIGQVTQQTNSNEPV